jgi:peptidoglycan hydrolase CwlO-like protein
MADEKGMSGGIQIAIAIIGLIGSLGVAWITTGNKFESELRENQSSVKSLQTEIQSVKDQLSAKIEESNKQLAEMKDLLASARKENESLLARINELKTQIESANKTVEEAKAVNQRLTVTTDKIRAINPDLIKKMQVPDK